MIGGREQEALAEINRAHELDPQSPVNRKGGRRYSRLGAAIPRSYSRFAASWQMTTQICHRARLPGLCLLGRTNVPAGDRGMESLWTAFRPLGTTLNSPPHWKQDTFPRAGKALSRKAIEFQRITTEEWLLLGVDHCHLLRRYGRQRSGVPLAQRRLPGTRLVADWFEHSLPTRLTAF